MKQPYEIHSDFFKKMISSGWYENRDIILESLPPHLEELPDEVKNFLREIWYLTVSYDACFVAAKQVGERTPTVDNQKIWSFFFRVFQSIQHTAVGLAASQKFGGYSVQHSKHTHSVSFQG